MYMHANPLFHWVPYGLGSELNQERNIKSAAAQRARMAAETGLTIIKDRT